jgi:hypothetical protein
LKIIESFPKNIQKFISNFTFNIASVFWNVIVPDMARPFELSFPSVTQNSKNDIVKIMMIFQM